MEQTIATGGTAGLILALVSAVVWLSRELPRERQLRSTEAKEYVASVERLMRETIAETKRSTELTERMTRAIEDLSETREHTQPRGRK